MSVHSDAAVHSVQNWLKNVVIDLNLCPFAYRELQRDSIRFSVCESKDPFMLANEFSSEILHLEQHPEVETCLIIIVNAFHDFLDFNEFLNTAETIISDMQFDGVFQVASFHRDYQFAGTQPDDAENYTNRSPYPILHILRESSLETAIERHPNTAQIPDDNIKLMNKLGSAYMSSLLASCGK